MELTHFEITECERGEDEQNRLIALRDINCPCSPSEVGRTLRTVKSFTAFP
jgi:hypothetical protein